MKTVVLFLSGLLFGLGLVVSGMANPEKVLGFLDVVGVWDPSLAFVMGGAVLVTFLGYKVILSKPHPFYASRFSLPTRVDIDVELVGGAALFGIGWGLVGICPGPELVVLAVAPMKALLFVVAMLAGMITSRLMLLKPFRLHQVKTRNLR